MNLINRGDDWIWKWKNHLPVSEGLTLEESTYLWKDTRRNEWTSWKSIGGSLVLSVGRLVGVTWVRGQFMQLFHAKGQEGIRFKSQQAIQGRIQTCGVSVLYRVISWQLWWLNVLVSEFEMHGWAHIKKRGTLSCGNKGEFVWFYNLSLIALQITPKSPPPTTTIIKLVCELCAWWKLILTPMNTSGGWRLRDELAQPAAVTSAVRDCGAV